MTSDSARRSSLGTASRAANLPARPVAGSIAARRAREAAGERTVLPRLMKEDS